jgi:outer membrane protein TolC
MILALIASLQLAAVGDIQQQTSDTIPTVTLEQALQAAAMLNPDYVAALGQIDNAKWGRRAALAVFIVPSITVQSSLTKASDPFFNLGTGGIASQIVDARLQLSYDLFKGGSKFFDYARTRAELESAQANELQARFATGRGRADRFAAVAARADPGPGRSVAAASGAAGGTRAAGPADRLSGCCGRGGG